MSNPCIKHSTTVLMDPPCLICIMEAVTQLQRVIALAIAWRLANREYIAALHKHDPLHPRSVHRMEKARGELRLLDLDMRNVLDAMIEQQEAKG